MKTALILLLAIYLPDSHSTETPASTGNNEFAFELNDTYGFPIDLTTLMAKEIGWTVDQAGFQQALQVQKDRWETPA